MPNVQEFSLLEIKLGLTGKLACLSLSLPVQKIKLVLHERDCQGEDFESANIVAKTVSITFNTHMFFPGDLTSSFLRRLAQSSCLEQLELSFSRVSYPSGPGIVDTRIPDNVANELIRVIDANQDLKAIRFNYHSFYIQWDEHVNKVVAALIRNRGLRCSDMGGFPISIDGEINQLFSAFRGFLRFTQEPQVVRQSLVLEMLGGRAVGNFQLSAMLLETNTDTLCELIQDSPNCLATTATSAKPASSNTKRQTTIRIQPARAAKNHVSNAGAYRGSSHSDKRKRKRKIQPARAAKKLGKR